MNLPHTTPNRIPAALALVIALTLACISFVLTPRLNETPVRVLPGLLLVRFLPGYSLVAALFPRKGGSGLDRTDRAQISGLEYRYCAADRSSAQLHVAREPAGACACRAVSVHDLACSGRVYTAGVGFRGGAVCGRRMGAEHYAKFKNKEL